MKKIIFFSFLLWAFASCQKKDIRELRSELSKQKDLIAQLQNTITAINTDIKGLQAITTALQNKVSVSSYTATSTGYLLTMSNGTTIELKNGLNGTNGTNGTNGADAPRIGVKQDADGQYYWTIGSDWLLQNGQKIRVTGNNGTNGNNGITPLLMVNATSNQWMVSYDNGNTWSVIKDGNGNPIAATGQQGQPGQTGPQGPAGPAGVAGFNITETDTAIIITYGGSTYTLPKGGSTGTSTVNKIIFATERAAGGTFSLYIDAALEDRADVWIDLNNDKKQDAGERINNFGFGITNANEITVGVTNTMTIYGNVTKLGLAYASITQLDVSKNIALKTLYCNVNSLTTLDVSKNSALTDLKCSYNNLTALDLSTNTALTNLDCSYNELTTLNVSTNTALTIFSCYYNQIKDANMTALINSLPNSETLSREAFIIGYLPGGSGGIPDQNTMPTSTALNTAKAKKWKLLNSYYWLLNP